MTTSNELSTQVREQLPAPSADTLAVKKQLADAIADDLRKRVIRASNIRGHIEITPPEHVRIDLETDTLPTSVDLTLDDWTFRLHCFEPQCRNGSVTYRVETE